MSTQDILSAAVFVEGFSADRAIFRPARIEDASFLSELAWAAYSKYSINMNKLPRPVYYNYHDLILKGDTFVALNNKNIIGMATLSLRDNYLLIQNIAISPQFQRKGLGKRFINYAKKISISKNISEMRLWTNEKMPGNLEMYISHGFQETHRQEIEGHRLIYLKKILINSDVKLTG